MFSPRFLSLLLSSSPCVCHDSHVFIKETCVSAQKRLIFPHMRPIYSPRFARRIYRSHVWKYKRGEYIGLMCGISLLVTSSPYVCLHVTTKETYISTQKTPIFPHMRPMFSPWFLSLSLSHIFTMCVPACDRRRNLSFHTKKTYISTKKRPIFPHKRDQYFHTRETNNISTQKTCILASLSFSYAIKSSPHVCHDSFIGCAMTLSYVWHDSFLFPLAPLHHHLTFCVINIRLSSVEI